MKFKFQHDIAGNKPHIDPLWKPPEIRSVHSDPVKNLDIIIWKQCQKKQNRMVGQSTTGEGVLVSHGPSEAVTSEWRPGLLEDACPRWS